MTIIIAGAGIGGLATALSLHDAGFTDIRIHDAVSEIRPFGVGINLLPHAVRELTELGLADQLEAMGVATSSLRYYNRHGQEIWAEPRGRAAGYHWPQYSVHRGELQMMLLDAVTDRLPAGSVRLGEAIDDVQDHADGASVRVTTAAGETRREVADLVIGADGIHSELRKQRYPDQGEPIWNGLILWRGTAVVDSFLDGRSMIMAGDAYQKFVAYPLSLPGDDGRARINFIAEYRSDEPNPGVSSWNRAADPAAVAARFADWTFDWLDVPTIIDTAEQILEYPMVDRDPLDQWTFGAQTLIGDAAHPMYPIGSNGASQAIIDARTLAYELANSATLADGVAAYEDIRRPRTTALIRSNRSMGPERVMQLAYERAPDGFADIETVVPNSEREQIARDYKAAGGFVAAELNERASLSVSGAQRSR